MFHKIQSKIQTKLIEASRAESSEGLIFFAHSVLKKQPKILSYNREVYLDITWKAMELAFTQRFITQEAKDDTIFRAPFVLFSALYSNDWKNILATITAVAKKKAPYNSDKMFNWPMFNRYGNEKKFELLYFLWSLLDSVILLSPKQVKLNTEYILKVLETTVSLRHNLVTEKAFGTLISLYRVLKTSFAIYVRRISFILQASIVPSNVLYKFLVKFINEIGPLADFSTMYVNVVRKFTNLIAQDEESPQDLFLIGRQENSTEFLETLKETETEEYEEDFDFLADLVICILENVPAFIPVQFIKRIQSATCEKLLSSPPTARDLRILNALLAFRHGQLSSPLHVARIIYSSDITYKTPELEPYVKIGRALCDAQRSVHLNSFNLVEVMETNDENNSIEKAKEPPKKKSSSVEAIEVEETKPANNHAVAAKEPKKKSSNVVKAAKETTRMEEDDDEIVFIEEVKANTTTAANSSSKNRGQTVPDMLKDLFAS